MAVNPDSTEEYSQYNMFQTADANGIAIMIVDTSEAIQINNRAHLFDFLNMFAARLHLFQFVFARFCMCFDVFVSDRFFHRSF